MAAPSYTTDLTVITVTDTAGGTTNWSALGGGASGLNSETDYFIQGDGCISKNGFTAATKGMIYNNGSTTIASGDAVFMWARQANRNLLAVQSSGGGQLLIGSGTSAFNQFYIDGKDVDGSDLLSWVSYVVDPTIPSDATTGSPTSTTSHFGFQWNIGGSGSLKGAPNGIDAIRHGRELRITDGDLGNGYATFDGAATFDAATTRRWGLLSPTIGGYLFHGAFVMGQSGTAVDFRDENRVITVLKDGYVTRNFNKFEILNASSNVEWTNILIQHADADNDDFPHAPAFFNFNVGTFVGNACQFTRGGRTLTNASTTLTDSTWDTCDRVEVVTSAPANLQNNTYRKVINKTLIDGQDQTNYQNSPINEGTFSGGTGHSVSDVITLENGVDITVDAVSSGAVTQFTVDSTGQFIGNRIDLDPSGSIDQVSTTGTGSGFLLRPQDLNYLRGGSLVWGVDVDPDGIIDGSVFINGTPGSFNGCHAIQFDSVTSGSSWTLRNCDFQDYAATNNLVYSTFYFTDTTGSVTLNLVGCTGNFSVKTEGITVTVLISPVTITTNVKNIRGENIEDARVQIEAGEKVTSGLPFRDSISITRSGSTASVSHTAHGLSNGEKVVIRHADQQEYNGNQTISNVSTNAYDFTVTGTPATPATSSYDHLINQQDETSYDNSPTTEGTFTAGTGYVINEIVTLEKGIKITVDATGSGDLIDAQDETVYDNSPADDGTFSGGSGHANSDVLTLDKGITVTVDNQTVTVVDQFTVDSSGQTAAIAEDETLNQIGTTGSGINFSLSPGLNNLTFDGDVTEFTVDSGGQLRRESVVSGTALGQISTTGSGSGFTLTPDTDNIDVDFIGSTYVLNAELTDASGNVSITKTLAVNQLMTGWARKSTASPYYKQANINFTADKDTGNAVNVTLLDDE